MLALDSDRWFTLMHAYGEAGNIPKMLRRLDAASYDYFFGALHHQGSAYTASYAAVPYLVEALAERPQSYEPILLVGLIEVARLMARAPQLPGDLESDYFEALGRVQHLTHIEVGCGDGNFVRSVMGTLAAIGGMPMLASAVFNLDADVMAHYEVNQSWDL